MIVLRFAAILCLSAVVMGCQDSPEPLKNSKQDVKPVAAKQKDQDDVKSPLVRRLLDMLDEVKGEGTDEGRRLIRKTLLDADVVLSKNLGKNALEQIRKANNKRPAFRVGGQRGPKVNTLPRKKKLAAKKAEAKKDADKKGADGGAKKDAAKKDTAKKVEPKAED